jgi:hypothetical protein
MPTSLNGSTWLILGIDDTTRIIFTGTYKSKTNIHQKIKNMVNLINNSSHNVFFLKGQGKPEFHSSTLIEKTTSSYIEQGKSQKEEALKAPFTLNVLE